VSRGGLKLRHALEHFVLPLRNAVAVDVGASTGGFTDVLLQSGVARVYAIDVGYGQLAWKLRNDPRVVVMERTNIRKVAELPEPIDVGVIDTSFISLRQVLPAVWPLLREGGHVVALVKPQFEAGRADVGKKGVVRDPVVWRRVLHEVVRRAQDGGWSVIGVERSPIRGPAGNVEFLAHLVKDGVSQGDTGAMIDRVIVDDEGWPDTGSWSSSLR
jgi:23S rRNA (cytidine1920-2'-O)/16S rRNA (cytidine1409-2'-O)-methyltransferase